ncbi:MAG: putative DNA modification/repair radical SAM protein [Clostridiales bacterium]|nr:putative DNA modification/repair radical SAM protein [Clostridiales bacterium]MDD7035916.1 putative DNA modification/repair radical SAM protein [Bacillota bacterium]
MRKLQILADSAKYDVSCSSSGSSRKSSGGLGNAHAAGICHSWASDGRCISLLKVLFTNKCAYDCEYCVNRRSNDFPRASFEPEELAELTMEFYRRNYIEGLFLSAAVEKSPDYTGERILRCLDILRNTYAFGGYIHAKIIPGMSRELVFGIGLLADRVSVNIEMPSSKSLEAFAPQKKPAAIFAPMKQITNTLIERKALKGPGNMFRGEDLNSASGLIGGSGNMLPARADRAKEVFAPAGQTTQMIVGAGGESDRSILTTSENLYKTFKMKRVYYSAYVPVVDSPILPGRGTPPPLKREHRIYQADWLLRFYGFKVDELFGAEDTELDPDLDPKVIWAIRHLDEFPVEVNTASPEMLLRIPGIGEISARRIIRQRRHAAVRYDDLKKMGVVLKRARYFILCCGRYYGEADFEPDRIRSALLGQEQGVQLSIFDRQEEQHNDRLPL